MVLKFLLNAPQEDQKNGQTLYIEHLIYTTLELFSLLDFFLT